MFRNQTGSLRADAEAIAERIRESSDGEDGEHEGVEERRAILRDVLYSFDLRLQNLPERERNAALSLLCKEIVDVVFDFHLSLETSVSRAMIAKAMTHAEKAKALHEFRLQVQDLAMLYGIK